jgi:hypothetical protein
MVPALETVMASAPESVRIAFILRKGEDDARRAGDLRVAVLVS